MLPGVRMPLRSVPAISPGSRSGWASTSSSGLAPHADPGPERLHLQGLQISETADRRVSRVEHLKAPVQQEAVDFVRADPAPDVIGGLPDTHVPSGRLQLPGTLQSGQTGTNHQHVT